MNAGPVQPFWPTGTVYGVALNFPGELAQLGARIDQAPHHGAPRAPVLFVKTANTWSPSGAPVALPPEVEAVEVAASVALVIGTGHAAVAGAPAPPVVAGYVLVSDLSVPHDTLYRPPVRHKCRDGFLGIGGACPAGAGCDDPARFAIEVRVDGVLQQTVRFDALLRDAPTLLADVAACMALRPGDLLMLGCDVPRPLARAGQRIELCMPAHPGFGTLVQTLVREPA